MHHPYQRNEVNALLPENFIDELKYASGIEQVISSYVGLKRRGSNLVGLCPFHSEKSPSFTVYPENGSYYCFGCGAGGDVITFIRQAENLEYMEAVRLLASRAGITVPEDTANDLSAKQKTRVLEINREAARFFHSCLLSEAGKAAITYIAGRGLPPKTVKKFGLGYAPAGWDGLKSHMTAKGFSLDELALAAVIVKGRNNSHYDMFRDRIMFPIIDLRGGVIGFGGRVMSGSGPKYLNSPDTPVFKKSRNLFALNFAKSEKTDTLILGEGYMDVIAMHQAGFANSVATLGTSLTAEQSRLIARYAKRVVIAYDSDGAGQNAAKRAINLLGQTDVSVSVLEMSGAKDPDEYIKKFGAVKFESLINSSKGAINYEIDKLKGSYDLEDPDEKMRFMNAFCGLMAGIDNDLRRDIHIGQVAKEMDISRDRITSAVDSIRKKSAFTAKKRETHNLAIFAQDKTEQSRKKPVNPNIGGFRAEENLLAILIEHPDCHEAVSAKLDPENFLDPDHRQLFHIICVRMSENRPVEPIHLSAYLTPPQMSRLSHIMAKTKDIKFRAAQADEYIRVIKSQNEVKNTDEVGAMSLEEYDTYMTSLGASKK